MKDHAITQTMKGRLKEQAPELVQTVEPLCVFWSRSAGQPATKPTPQDRGSEGAPLGGGRADRAGDAAKQASPKGGRGPTQDVRRSRWPEQCAKRLTYATAPAHHQGDSWRRVGREATEER